MTIKTTKDFIQFNYNSLYGALALGPAVAMSLTESVSICVTTAVAGLASAIVCNQVAKICVDRKWTSIQTNAALFISSIAVFAISAAALAVLGVPGIIQFIFVGCLVSIVNTAITNETIDIARAKARNQNDWQTVHDKMQGYTERYQEYLAIHPGFTENSPSEVLKCSFNTPEKGTLFLYFFKEYDQKLNELLFREKNKPLLKSIQKKKFRYGDLYAQLNKDQRAGLNSTMDMYSLAHIDWLTPNLNDAAAKVDTILDQELSKILARYQELNLEPAA